jgi:serine phosphatase RsbU (regulator of sigma subunit)
MRRLFLAAIIAVCHSGFGQGKIDSLIIKLAQSNADSNKVNLYVRVARELLYVDAKRSTPFADSAIELSGKLSYPRGKARALIAKGIYHRNSGEYDKGFEAIFEAIKIAEKLKDNKLIAQSYNNLGVLYKNQGKYIESVKALKISQKYYRLANDRNGVATTFQNMSNAYRRNKQFDQAIQSSTEAYKIYEAARDDDGLISALSSLGAVYQEDKKDFKKALTYFLKAEELLTKGNRLNDKAVACQNLGATYLGLGDYSKAEEYLKKSLDFAKTLNNPEQDRDNYNLLAELYETTGNMKMALHYHKLFHALFDSISKRRYEKATLELEEKFQSEKSKKEIELLSSVNELKTKENEAQKRQINQNRIIILCGAVVALVIASLAFLFYRNFKNTQKLNRLLSAKNGQIESQKKEILDSILYARRIQNSILPHEEELTKCLPKHFVIYKPRDIVSGDFYWTYYVKQTEDRNPLTVVALCDCTGHGVPGAFMSLISYTLLNHIVKDPKTDASNVVLDFLSRELPVALNAGGTVELRDGLDIALAVIDFKSLTMQCSMAHIPVYICDGKSLRCIEPDKQSISADNTVHPAFSLNQVQLKPGDRIYFTTDGYADQFGGTKGKKLKYKELEKLLLESWHLPLQAQKEKLESFFEGWKGALEQVDDVTLIGIEV